MRKYVRLHWLVLFTALFMLLMGTCAFADVLGSGDYRLTSRGYIAWSDFKTTEGGNVTFNVSTSTLDNSGLTSKTLSSLTYQIVDLLTGRTLQTYTRYGTNRYVQVNSTRTQVNDRIVAYLPAGSYRFRITDTEAVRQPVHLVYYVTGKKGDVPQEDATLVVSPVSLKVGQIIRVPMKNSKGTRVRVTDNRSSDPGIAWTHRDGTYLIIGASKVGTCQISVTYLGRVYQIKVNVVAQRPELRMYIRNISVDRKYMYIRVYNSADKPAVFFGSGASQYQVSGSDSNTAKATLLSGLKIAGKWSVTVNPGRWTTIRLMRRSGLFTDRSVKDMEVWLRFRFNNVKYTAGIEDNWLDGQYRLRRKTSTWYPAYSTRNNFSKAGRTS